MLLFKGSATLHCTTAAGAIPRRRVEKLIPRKLLGHCRSLHCVAHAFHFAKDTHQVATENLVNVLRAIAAIEKSLHNFSEVRLRIDSVWTRTGHAVQIRTKAHVSDAGSLRDVIDLV